MDSLQYIDHVVIGSFKSPYLMGNPASRDPDARFNVSFRTGEGEVTDRRRAVGARRAEGEGRAEAALPRRVLRPRRHRPRGRGAPLRRRLRAPGDRAHRLSTTPATASCSATGDQRLARALLGPNCVVPFFDGDPRRARARSQRRRRRRQRRVLVDVAHLPHARQRPAGDPRRDEPRPDPALLRRAHGDAGPHRRRQAGDRRGLRRQRRPRRRRPERLYFATGESLGGS